MQSIIKIDLQQLSVHPLSLSIFGELDELSFSRLKQDIANRGLQYPLEIDHQNRVICGSQRLQAIAELGWREVEVIRREDLKTEEEIRTHLILDNVLRRHLTAGQIYRAGVELEKIYAVQAKERQLSGKKDTLGSADPKVQGKTREQVAKDLNISGSTYERTKQIFESGEKDIIEAVEQGKISIAAAAEKVRKPRIETPAATGARADLLRYLKFERESKAFIKIIKRNKGSSENIYRDEWMKMIQMLQKELAELEDSYAGGSEKRS